MHNVGQVEEDPAQHAGAQFAEDFDVDQAEEGEGDARVELPADEPVVNEVAGVATLGKLALLFVFWLDGEAGGVDVAGEGEGDDEVGGDELWLVVPDVSP